MYSGLLRTTKSFTSWATELVGYLIFVAFCEKLATGPGVRGSKDADTRLTRVVV